MSKNRTKSNRSNVAWYVVLAIVLVAVIVGGIITHGFRDWTACACFGHTYGDDNKCIRCGADKPAEEPKPEHEQPKTQSFVSEPIFFAAANTLFSSTSDGRTIPNGYRAAKVGDTIMGFNNIVYFLDVRKVPSHYEWVESTKILDLDNGKTLYGVGNIDDDFYGFYYADVNCEYTSEAMPGDLHLYDVMGERDYETENSNGFGPFPGSAFSEIGCTGTVTAVYVDALYINPKYTPVPPTAPTKTGYTFTGWYTDEACTQLYTEQYVTSDITLYAGFRAHTYNVKFNANGGNGEMTNEPMTYDQSKALTTNAFSKEHYAFKGWATSADGNVVYSNSQSVKNLTAEDNATVELFAIWERSEVVVTFVEENRTYTKVVPIRTAISNMPEEPKKEGYLFAGWYTSDNVRYDGGVVTEDMTLTARFEIIRCTITFIVDGKVYCVYICDWGTSILDALNASGINTALYKVDEHSRNF